MEIEFLGVGEAFDTGLGNSSFLLRSESTLLIDCGFAIPERFFNSQRSLNVLNAIYLTHFHADHTFGLPALLLRLREDGRSDTLTIIGQPGIGHFVQKLVELAYPGNFSRLGYPIEFIETVTPCRFNELTLTFAPTMHGVRNFAIRVSAEEERIAFSGDGELTAESRELYAECNVLVHEAFTLEGHTVGHTSAAELLEAAAAFPILETLFLVHINRNERRSKKEQFIELGSTTPYSLIVPEPGFEFSLL